MKHIQVSSTSNSKINDNKMMTLNAHKYDLIKQTDSFDFRQN